MSQVYYYPLNGFQILAQEDDRRSLDGNGLNKGGRTLDVSPAPNKPVTEDYDGTNHVSQSALLIAL